ncbi:MAG: Rieske 2Fe-2S domain-containing protein [Candidatus Bathyarchaeota archaeon]|nr:Rieske 2Fe-2S domain-containing protein [Candidatus Bathyarchaeota archaeon]
MSKLSRRSFVNIFFGGSLIGTILAFLYPIIRFIVPPKQAESVINKVEAAKVGELTPHSFKIFKFGNSPGILINTPSGELKAFTAICTHLACTVRYDDETETIHCPCHNGRFDLNGNVLSGPPPAPLEEYAVEISNGNIFVTRRS